MMVVRLPDSPTEYGVVAESPQIRSILDSGTSSASEAIIAIVVFAPAPISVTPTRTAYRPFASTVIVALLRPRPERNAMNETPTPRRIGPASVPAGRHFFFQSNVSMPQRRHSSSV